MAYGTSSRDGITQALINQYNPDPGYLGGAPGLGPTPPFGGIPGGAQPQASLGPAQPPLGPMGAGIPGPATQGLPLSQPGLNLPGVTQPGTLPQSMNPQNVLGGMGQQQPPVSGRPY
jgi:hypothetical protein